MKASRYLTHMKRLREIADAVARFWEPLEPLRRGRRLGPALWQLPENFPRDDDLLASALDELPRASHCFELRHPSWFAAPIHDWKGYAPANARYLKEGLSAGGVG